MRRPTAHPCQRVWLGGFCLRAVLTRATSSRADVRQWRRACLRRMSSSRVESRPRHCGSRAAEVVSLYRSDFALAASRLLPSSLARVSRSSKQPWQGQPASLQLHSKPQPQIPKARPSSTSTYPRPRPRPCRQDSAIAAACPLRARLNRQSLCLLRLLSSATTHPASQTGGRVSVQPVVPKAGPAPATTERAKHRP